MDKNIPKLSPSEGPVPDVNGAVPVRWWLKGQRALVPGLILGGSLLLSLCVYFGILADSIVAQIAVWTAVSTSYALNTLGFSTTVTGTILSSNTFSVIIVAECTAIGPLILFMGAVSAYPSKLKSKAIGFLIGLLALTGINLIRIMSLFWIGLTFPQYLNVAHLLVWQSLIIIFAIVLWLLWVDRIANVRNV